MRNELIAFNKGYRIAPNGDIYNHKGVKINGRVLSAGYVCLSVRYRRKILKCPVHRLQAYQKYGEELYRDGMEVRHKNGIKTDNSHSNILIGTHSDNMMDIPSETRINNAINASSYIKKHDKDTIRSFYQKSQSYKKTMSEFSISSKGTLHYIINL